MKKAKTVDSYIGEHPTWSKELSILRKLLQKTELVETVKWGMPVYTLGGKNVVGITGFKKHFGFWFYQGSFLSDPEKLLRNAQEGKTKGMRHLNYSDIKEVDKKIAAAYIKEAIANQKAGKMIKAVVKSAKLPAELIAALDKDKKLAKAYETFSMGNKKDFCEYISSAKMEKTKLRRLDKILPMILEGEGLNDKYKRK